MVTESRSNAAFAWGFDLAAVIAGAGLALAFAPIDLWWLSPLSLLGLIYLIADTTGRRAVWRGWLFGVGLFGVGVSWVSESFQYNHIAYSVALSLTTAFVLFLALFPALAVWLARRLSSGRGYPLGLSLAGAWVLLEWGRGEFLTGFTWLQLGYSQLGSPLAGYAPVFGTLGMSLLLGLSVVGVVFILERYRRSGIQAFAATVVIASLWLGGVFLKTVQWTSPAGPPIAVALVQGNVSQDKKWRADQRIPTLRLYTEHTRRNWNADLVVWPETAVPAFYRQASRFLAGLGDEAKANQTELLVGLPVQGDDGPHNSVYHVGTQTFYHKRHLVPFGEYLPLDGIIRPLAEAAGIPVPSFRHGAWTQPLFSINGVPMAMMICYEVAFGDEVASHLPSAQVLLSVSNDAWFGDSLAPHQHLQMAQMRALETGRHLARATNTGISAFIGPDGALRSQTEQFTETVLTDTVVPMSGATPYTKWRDIPALIASALLLGGCCVRARRVRSNGGSHDRG
ncbi:MAG: apolipoprotein N-acyltransferase [Pseudomonadota bacterium]